VAQKKSNFFRDIDFLWGTLSFFQKKGTREEYMRAVVQRVKFAMVEVDGAVIGEIGAGLLIFIGIEGSDTQKDTDYIADKCAGLRIFDDEAGIMNKSVQEAGGGMLVVSQFTIMGDVRHGRRPSYIKASPPDAAVGMFEDVLATFRKTGMPVQTGKFGADMQVSLLNDGPVTILLDSKKLF
jgi:D-aminoacyl-tRNA deacylase